jgi:hypothetical protein
MEVMANSAFDAFRDMYYMGGYSSVYFWDLDEGFASCWLIKKASDPTIKSGTKQIPRYTVRYGTASQPGAHRLRCPVALIPNRTVSRTARYPEPHGIPNRTVSRTARYPEPHGIPNRTVSRTARYPEPHGIPNRTVSQVSHRGIRRT